MDQLTKDWSEGWREKQALLEQYGVDVHPDRAGLLLNGLQPHLVSLDRDLLSPAVLFHHLRVMTRMRRIMIMYSTTSG